MSPISTHRIPRYDMLPYKHSINSGCLEFRRAKITMSYRQSKIYDSLLLS